MRLTQLMTFVNGSLAFFLNLFLLPIITLKSSEKIRRYKYFLLAYTANATVFCFSQASAMPAWYIPNNGYLFVSTATYLARTFQQIQILIFVACYTINGIIILWSFIYRQGIIENQPVMSKKSLIITIVGSLCFAAALMATVQNILPSEEIDLLFFDEVLNSVGVKMNESGYIGGVITIGVRINTGMFLCLGVYSLFINITCVIILICWLKMGKKLRVLRALSNAKYKFQHKLFILLTLQVSMPIIFNILPAVTIFGFSLTKNSIGEAALFFGIFVTFAQIIDPICTIFLVQDYKNFVFRKKASSRS